ncbi:MAG: hypothetical protein AB7O44_26560 [Hyphomicrobiaceae bacterium]
MLKPRARKPNAVLVKRIEKFHGVDLVLYTHIGANIERLTTEHLAELAVASVATAPAGKDGISYLMAALARNLKTPLSDDYVAQIKLQTGAHTLPAALERLRAASRP